MLHRFSATLSWYIVRQTMVYFAIIIAAIAGIIILADTVELLRRAAGREGVSTFVVLQMALCKLPEMMEKVLPFAMMFAVMAVLVRFSKSQQLVVMRAAGVSVWQFLGVLMVLALVLGAARVLILNPIAAYSMAQYESMENKYLRSNPNAINVSRNGLWLRQRDSGRGETRGHSLLHAQRVSPSGMELLGVTVFRFNAAGDFLARLDVRQAALQQEHWLLVDGWLSIPGQASQYVESYEMPTTFTRARLQDSFARPSTLPFWQLPQFIEMLQNAGFPALRHKVHFYSLLATPLQLAALVLVAAVFSMQNSRRGNIMRLLVGGIAAGFLLYFANDVVAALGISGRMPIGLTVTAVPLIYAALAISILLHTEDG